MYPWYLNQKPVKWSNSLIDARNAHFLQEAKQLSNTLNNQLLFSIHCYVRVCV